MPRTLPHRRSRIAEMSVADNGDLRTVLVALVGNLVIAVAKLVAGLLSNSAGMLAESAHSFADSTNEILLGLSLMSSRKTANAEHPFGYGRERFLWAFLAAVMSFVVGGCVSIGLAIHEFATHAKEGSQTISWIVIVIALIADGISWFQGIGQGRREAKERNKTIWSYLWQTSDPVLRAVILEDTAGLIGTSLAALGLWLSRLAGNSVPDATASLLIGFLLAGTAIALARPLADFLIGRNLSSEYLETIHRLFAKSEVVEELIGLQAVYTGPGEVIVVAKINPKPGTVAEFASAMDVLDHQIRDAVPLVADVFVDVTMARKAEEAETSRMPKKG